MAQEETIDAGAPEDRNEPEITPAMLSAGVEAVVVVLDESSTSFCEVVAKAAYRAMELARRCQSAA